MSSLCALQSVLYAWYTGELSDAIQFLTSLDALWPVVRALLGNAAMAFAMSFVSFYANRATSTLSVAVVGNVKQVALIALAVLLFSEEMSAFKLFGIALTVLGGFCYTCARAQTRLKR